MLHSKGIFLLESASSPAACTLRAVGRTLPHWLSHTVLARNAGIAAATTSPDPRRHFLRRLALSLPFAADVDACVPAAVSSATVTMARGPKKHLKRLNAPKHWMLSKMGGIWAPKPSCGPHKLRESLPLSIILRNRLKYALTRKESLAIVMQKLVKVDGKVRTDLNFPAGFMGASTLQQCSHAAAERVRGPRCYQRRCRSRFSWSCCSAALRAWRDGNPAEHYASCLLLVLHLCRGASQPRHTRLLSAPCRLDQH